MYRFGKMVGVEKLHLGHVLLVLNITAFLFGAASLLI
jgi:hypothetical protein